MSLLASQPLANLCTVEVGVGHVDAAEASVKPVGSFSAHFTKGSSRLQGFLPLEFCVDIKNMDNGLPWWRSG